MTRNHTHTQPKQRADFFAKQKHSHTHTYTDTKLHAEMKPKKNRKCRSLEELQQPNKKKSSKLR